MRFLTLIHLITLLHPADAAETVLPPRDPDCKLVWADEFNHAGPPDPTKWTYETGFERNEELQWYKSNNAFCENGTLVIEARRERVVNPGHLPNSPDWRKSRATADYTSASLIAAAGQEWQFGRLEVRARFKALGGLWPAIWTTGLGRWPHAGEIDIMEYYQGKILANFVWAGKGGKDFWASSQHPLGQFNAKTWDERFHVWVTEWDREKIDIYLDGQLLNTLRMKTTANQHGPPINPFLFPQRLRLNLAVGGAGGNPAKTVFPQRYEIDYVRVFEK